MTDKIKDKILYLRLKQKDKDAFVKAYDLYLDQIYRYVFFKVSSKEEAEDIVSQTFLKAWNYIQDNSISDFKTLKALFYKVARNLVIDHYRKKSKDLGVSINATDDESEMQIADDSQDLVKDMEISSDMETVNRGLQELKEEYRDIIVMRFIDELSVTEISQIIEKSKGATRVLIHRSITSLKKVLKSNEE